MNPKPDGTFDPRSEPAKTLGEFPYFTARPVKTIDNSPPWESYEIGVFEHRADGSAAQIGSYQRNDECLQAFWWFRLGSRHLALYSPDYTATRLMEIFPGSVSKTSAAKNRPQADSAPLNSMCRILDNTITRGYGGLIFIDKFGRMIRS